MDEKVVVPVRIPFAGHVDVMAWLAPGESVPPFDLVAAVTKDMTYQLTERWRPLDDVIAEFDQDQVEAISLVQLWPVPARAQHLADRVERMSIALDAYDQHKDWWSVERDKYRDEHGDVRPELAAEYEKAVQQYDEVACDVMDTLADMARDFLRGVRAQAQPQ